MPSALVTGVNGYVGEHLAKYLLSQGYNVIGAVRSQEKGDRLKSHFKSGFEYEVVGDFSSAGVFDQVLKNHPDVDFFFHVASPLASVNGEVEETILKPAVDGTLGALKAAKAYGTNLKAFVLTSSLAALVDIENPTNHLTEDSWNPLTRETGLVNDFIGYLYAKTAAEKAAWKFVEEEKPHFKFTAVLPSYVFGPIAFDSEAATPKGTPKLLTRLVDLQPTDPLPELQGSYIDVRDVARAHFLAATSEAAFGKRIVLSNGGFTTQLTIDILHEKYPHLSANLPRGDPSSTAEGVKNATHEDFSKTQKILGFKYTPFEKSLTDQIDQYFAAKK